MAVPVISCVHLYGVLEVEGFTDNAATVTRYRVYSILSNDLHVGLFCVVYMLSVYGFAKYELYIQTIHLQRLQRHFSIEVVERSFSSAIYQLSHLHFSHENDVQHAIDVLQYHLFTLADHLRADYHIGSEAISKLLDIGLFDLVRQYDELLASQSGDHDQELILVLDKMDRLIRAFNVDPDLDNPIIRFDGEISGADKKLYDLAEQLKLLSITFHRVGDPYPDDSIDKDLTITHAGDDIAQAVVPQQLHMHPLLEQAVDLVRHNITMQKKVQHMLGPVTQVLGHELLLSSTTETLTTNIANSSASIVEGLTTIGTSVLSLIAAASVVVAPLFAILGFYKAVTIASPPGTKADCDMVKAAMRAGKQEIQNSASTRHDGISGHVTR